MKTLYLKTLAKLQEITDLKYIDLDTGQLDAPDADGRYPVNFPCALIGVQIPRARDHNQAGSKQEVEALINIRLGVDFSGNTSSTTPEGVRAESLGYFELADLIWEKLQGWKDSELSQFSRVSAREERRGDRVKVVNIPFSTGYIQTKTT